MFYNFAFQHSRNYSNFHSSGIPVETRSRTHTVSRSTSHWADGVRHRSYSLPRETSSSTSQFEYYCNHFLNLLPITFIRPSSLTKHRKLLLELTKFPMIFQLNFSFIKLEVMKKFPCRTLNTGRIYPLSKIRSFKICIHDANGECAIRLHTEDGKLVGHFQRYAISN